MPSVRDEGTTLSWHLDHSNTYQSLLDKTADMAGFSKFARGTLSRAVSTNSIEDKATTWEWTRIAETPATYIKTVMLQVPAGRMSLARHPCHQGHVVWEVQGSRVDDCPRSICSLLHAPQGPEPQSHPGDDGGGLIRRGSEIATPIDFSQGNTWL
jgi:hypothetical protein